MSLDARHRSGCRPGARRQRQLGFNLVEIAISLVIIGLITRGAIASISQQNEQRKLTVSRSQLAQARDSLTMFLTTSGRLPCPATLTSGGQEAIAANVGGVITCTLEAGYLPAVTLGLPELDASGMLNNGWDDGARNAGLPRVFRYAVSSLSGTVANALTSPGLGAPTVASRRVDVQTAITNGQGLFVCASATGIVGSGLNRCGATANLLGSNAAAVVWTLGANGNDPTAYSIDEQQNANLGVPRVFISRPLAPVGASGGGFDDLVSWVSFNQVADRLFSGGFVL